MRTAMTHSLLMSSVEKRSCGCFRRSNGMPASSKSARESTPCEANMFTIPRIHELELVISTPSAMPHIQRHSRGACKSAPALSGGHGLQARLVDDLDAAELQGNEPLPFEILEDRVH